MPFRLAAAALLLAAAGCGITGSDPGAFEATLSGDVTATLAGSAISDVQAGGATVALFPDGGGVGAQILISIREAVLAEGTIQIDPATDAAALTYARNTPSGGRVVLSAVDGDLTLTRIDDASIDGRFDVTATADGLEVRIEGTFRAPRAFGS